MPRLLCYAIYFQTCSLTFYSDECSWSSSAGFISSSFISLRKLFRPMSVTSVLNKPSSLNMCFLIWYFPIPALPNQTQDFMAYLCYICKSILLLQSVSSVSKLAWLRQCLLAWTCMRHIVTNYNLSFLSLERQVESSYFPILACLELHIISSYKSVCQI